MTERLELITGLSGERIAGVVELPGQIVGLLEGAQGSLERVRDGAADGNPLAELLGTLRELASRVGSGPSLDGVVAGLGELLDELPAERIGAAGEAAEAIEALLALFGPVRDALDSGSFEEALTEAVEGVAGAIGTLAARDPDATELGGHLQEFLELLRSLAGWRRSPPSGEELADFLSRAFAGMPLDVLAGPAAALDAALRPLDEILPDGPELATWTGAHVELEAFWAGLSGRIEAGAAVDWPAVEREIQASRARLVELVAVRDRLFAISLSRVNGLRLGDLGTVAAALDALPQAAEARLTPILEGLRDYVVGMADDLEGWAPTPEELRASVRQLVDRFLGEIERSPMGELRRLIVVFQQRLLRAVEELPFRDLAADAEAALRRLAEAADLFDPEAVRRPVRDAFEQVRTAIGSVPRDEVRAAVEQVWEEVESVLAEVTARIEAARETLEEAVAGVASYVERAQPALDRIAELTGEVRARLEGFDLAEPCGEVVDALAELEAEIAALDLSDLPDVVVAALDEGAELLARIDLTAEVRGPIEEGLETADPTPLIERATEVLDGLLAELRTLDPAAVAAELDEPVDELLDLLSQFGPARLADLLEEAVAPVRRAVESIDVAALLRPVTELFARLAAQVDAFLDPDAIFAPLEELFRPVRELVAALEPARLVRALGDRGGAVGSALAGGAEPAAATGAGLGALRDAVEASPAADELAGFRPGDLLIPLVDLHRQMTAALDRLSDELLGEADRALRAALPGRLRELGAAGVARRVDSAILRVEAEFDAAAVAGRLAESALAYLAARAALAAAAAADLDAEDRAAAERVLAALPDLDPRRLVPAAGQGEALLAASVRVEASLDLAPLRRGGGGAGVESALPGFLATAEAGADGLRAALAALDPAPLRDEINTAFDRIGRRIAELEPALAGALDELLTAAQELLLPVTPARLVDLASRLHAALAEQLLALGPETFKDEVKLVFDVVKRQLAVLDPAFLVGELEALRGEAVEALDGLVGELVPESAAFDELMVRLAEFKPSRLLAPLTEALEPFSELVRALDPAALFEPLLAAIERVRGQVPDCLAEIEAGLDAVLRAFPDAGGSGAGAGGQAGVGVG